MISKFIACWQPVCNVTGRFVKVAWALKHPAAVVWKFIIRRKRGA